MSGTLGGARVPEKSQRKERSVDTPCLLQLARAGRASRGFSQRLLVLPTLRTISMSRPRWPATRVYS
jgi:hypothetical protein